MFFFLKKIFYTFFQIFKHFCFTIFVTKGCFFNNFFTCFTIFHFFNHFSMFFHLFFITFFCEKFQIIFYSTFFLKKKLNHFLQFDFFLFEKIVKTIFHFF